MTSNCPDWSRGVRLVGLKKGRQARAYSNLSTLSIHKGPDENHHVRFLAFDDVNEIVERTVSEGGKSHLSPRGNWHPEEGGGLRQVSAHSEGAGGNEDVEGLCF